jgi:hypothetical protein
MPNKIAIPIDSEIIGEMYLRLGSPRANITDWIENVVRDYLDRTADDGDWSETYYAYRERQSFSDDFTAEYGDPKGGYHWAPLFLPNGTLIRMEYKKETSQAAVKNNKIDFKGENYSPSELARFIASGTNRNAWRDLLIKRPSDTDWCMADDLRRRLPK